MIGVLEEEAGDEFVDGVGGVVEELLWLRHGSVVCAELTLKMEDLLPLRFNNKDTIPLNCPHTLSLHFPSLDIFVKRLDQCCILLGVGKHKQVEAASTRIDHVHPTSFVCQLKLAQHFLLSQLLTLIQLPPFVCEQRSVIYKYQVVYSTIKSINANSYTSTCPDSLTDMRLFVCKKTSFSQTDRCSRCASRHPEK